MTFNDTIFGPTLLPRVTEETVKSYSDKITALTCSEEGQPEGPDNDKFRQMRVNAVAQFKSEHPGVWNLFFGNPVALDALVTFWTLLALQEAEDIKRAC